MGRTRAFAIRDIVDLYIGTVAGGTGWLFGAVLSPRVGGQTIAQEARKRLAPRAHTLILCPSASPANPIGSCLPSSRRLLRGLPDTEFSAAGAKF